MLYTGKSLKESEIIQADMDQGVLISIDKECINEEDKLSKESTEKNMDHNVVISMEKETINDQEEELSEETSVEARYV